jgi:membrane protein YdbS with pleckstrin-like domain
VGPARDLLHEDEELLAEVRPHPIVVVGPVLVVLVAVAGAATIAISYPGAPVVVAWLLAAMIVLPVLWLLARLLRWRSVRFLVTSSRLLYRRGVIGRDVVQLRFQRVAEVHCSQSVGGRLIGCGRLVFEVAGGDEPLVVEDVRRPRRLQRVITAQLDRFDLPYGAFGGQGGYGGYQMSRSAATAPAPATRAGASWEAARPTGRPSGRGGRGGRSHSWTDTPPHGVLLGDDGTEATTIPGQILQLDELRRRGILSEEEFAAKKAELLGRL